VTCPVCGHRKTRVVNQIVWRKRRCLKCGHEWNTSEVEDEPVALPAEARYRMRLSPTSGANPHI
jgi:transcriptional regulator NrdR family protein